MMPIELILHNIAFGFTFLICLGLGIFVYVRRPKENNSVNKVFLLNTIAFCVWQISYALGTNIADPLWSRFAFMFNLSSLLVVVMNIHLILAITGRFQKQKKIIIVFYAVVAGFIVFFSFNPDLFLAPSQPVLYLQNFMRVGPLYWLQDSFFVIIVIYLLVQMVHSYHYADPAMRNRLKYVIGGFIYAYFAALMAEFLLYDIPIDPFIASLSGLYTVPLAYAILKYEVISINVIAKRALIYALSTAGITLLILFIGYANNAITEIIPGFPEWVLPLISGIVGVMVGVFIWRKIQEVDFLKFQFIDVVTHKFRTPLTHIKWSAEMLRGDADPKDKAEAVAAIEDANVRLFEMTNDLINLSRADDNQYQYEFKPANLVDILNETLATVETHKRTKGVDIKLHIPDGLPNVLVDRTRIQFVMQMIIENAIIYSNPGGTVDITIERHKTSLYLMVHDAGIGISREDMDHLFSRFFRASNASQAHTEGLGIGLYVSRDIMKRHHGDLWAESPGHGQGSTFVMKIPLER